MSSVTIEIDHVLRQLVQTYGDRYPDAVVRSAVLVAHRRLESARVRTFVPVLTERFAREILNQSPQPPGYDKNVHVGGAVGRQGKA